MEQQGSPAQAASVGGLGAAALVALACGTTLGNVGGNVMPALLAGFGERFSLTDTAAGMVAAAQLLATAVVTLLLAARASRSGRVQLARIGLIVATIGFAAAWLSPTVAILVGANVAAGAGLGAVFAAGTAALGSTPDVDRATFRTVLVATLATAALILAVSFANEAGGGTAGFAVLAACCAFGLWGVRGLPERPGDHAAETGPRPSLLFLAAVLAFGVVEQGTWSYAAVFGMRHAGLAEGAASLALSVAALAALVGVPLGTFASLRLGRVVALVGVALLEFAARTLVVVTESAAVFSVATSLWQVCYLALLVQILALAAGLDRSGRLVAATAGAVALGTGLGPAVIGAMLDAIGPWGLAVALLALGILALVPLARFAARVPTTAPAGAASARNA
ncbi:putative MFS family arabinose efflux permease [Leucobacter komagatae]|uniref:Putative MFS family arabinose efflux permease n=1 Tax=Leucobacter komagatae TaxID=55969 RepID=A0A542Y607_9MICO|nr:MFS transporter [Leucobacter komagatae]TQL43514.1 putative MFS family arabinose efflux permease [Leucobacter komagatae]